MSVLTRRPWLIAALAAFLAAALAVGIAWLFTAGNGDGSSPTAHPSESASTAPGASITPGDGPSATSSATTTVKVYFHRGSDDARHVEPLTRTVARTTTPATAAVVQLLAGPTEAERSAGYSSFFSSATAGKLRSVTVEKGVAYADFQDLRQIIPNASSSYGSAALLAELDATLRQFSTVRSTIYSFNNDPGAFYSWLQLVTPRVDGTNQVAAVYAARRFLADVAGMTDPAEVTVRAVGSDGAAVEVHPRGENGAPVSAAATTVSLRRGASAWSVTGATTETIVVERHTLKLLGVRADLVEQLQPGGEQQFVRLSGCPLRRGFEWLVLDWRGFEPSRKRPDRLREHGRLLLEERDTNHGRRVRRPRRRSSSWRWSSGTVPGCPTHSPSSAATVSTSQFGMLTRLSFSNARSVDGVRQPVVAARRVGPLRSPATTRPHPPTSRTVPADQPKGWRRCAQLTPLRVSRTRWRISASTPG